MKKEKSIWVLDPTPPGFPAAVTTGAGVSPTAPRPCGGAPLHVGPSGLGFQRAPCGLLQSAGSAPSAGLESFPFPWLPGGRERAGAIKRTSRVEEEKKRWMKNDKWRRGGRWCTKKSSDNDDECMRKSDRETERGETYAVPAPALIGKCLHSASR